MEIEPWNEYSFLTLEEEIGENHKVILSKMFYELDNICLNAFSFFLLCSCFFITFLLGKSPREAPETLGREESDTLHILFDPLPILHFFDADFFDIFSSLSRSECLFPSRLLCPDSVGIDATDEDDIFPSFHA